MKKHIIDTDADPKIPEWATLVTHKKSGKWTWNPKEIELHLEPEQRESIIGGKELYERIKDTAVMNVNVANFLLENQKLYPKVWENKYIYFWGTIVRHRDGRLLVPCLVERGGEVHLNWDWLGNDWADARPAARFARLSSEPLIFDPVSFDRRLKKLEALINPKFL